MPANELQDHKQQATSKSGETGICDEVRQVKDKERNSATVKMKLNDHTTNALLDTGAGKSVIDHGSLTAIGLEDKIRNNEDDLLNASGNQMDIIGEVDIDVKFNGQVVVQTFKVLNTETFSNILLGRDFSFNIQRESNQPHNQLSN